MWLLVAIPAFIIFYQDLRYREISWWTLPLLFISLIPKYFVNNSWSILIEQGVINSLITIIELLLIFLYFSIKNKKITNVFTIQLGIGDVLFLLIIGPFFHPMLYVWFQVSSLILILFFSLIYGVIKKNWNYTIPLAGILSILLLLLNTYNYFFPILCLRY